MVDNIEGTLICTECGSVQEENLTWNEIHFEHDHNHEDGWIGFEDGSKSMDEYNTKNECSIPESFWKEAQLAEAKIPYISLCTDPTTGGTTASFAMLGDINIAEPNALIAFAGPRVVRDTTGKDLPEGFQRSEFVLEHGFLDGIYERKNLKKQINLYIDLIQNQPIRA